MTVVKTNLTSFHVKKENVQFENANASVVLPIPRPDRKQTAENMESP